MIGAIETAILARLSAASKSGGLGYAFREVISLPLELDEEQAARAQQFPAAWTVFGGYKPIGKKGRLTIVRGTFYVVLASQHVQNETARRLAEGSEPGVYQMGEDVVGLLFDQDLGLDIEPFELGEFVSLQSQMRKLRGVALWAHGFTTEFVIEPRRPQDLAGLKILHANWDIPRFGGVDADLNAPGVQLPADAKADATTHLVLSEEP